MQIRRRIPAVILWALTVSACSGNPAATPADGGASLNGLGPGSGHGVGMDTTTANGTSTGGDGGEGERNGLVLGSGN